MRTLHYIIGLALIICVLGSEPVRADIQYKTVVVALLSPAPVSLDTCEVWARDWNMSTFGMHKSIPNYYIDAGVKFTNLSTKTIKDMRFELTSYDAFNAVLGMVDLDTSANDTAHTLTFAPGEVVDLLGPHGWNHGININQTRDHVSCAVAKVLFDDGTIWSAP